MTQAEVESLRRAHWAARPPVALDAEAVRGFVEEFGFTSFGPFAGRELPAIADLVAPAAPSPTPIEASVPATVESPDQPAVPAETAAERESREARLHAALEAELAARRVLELRCWPGGALYVPRELGPFLYATVGDSRPRHDYQVESEQGRLSWLAAEVFSRMLDVREPLTVAALRQTLGSQRTSATGIDRALAELSTRLRVLRVGSQDGEGLWQPAAYALGAEMVRQSETLGSLHATAAIVSKWLATMIVDSEEAMGEFFSPLLTRGRIHAVLLALQAGRSLLTDSLEGRQAFRLS